MTKIFAAMENELLVLRQAKGKGGWQVKVELKGNSPQSVAVDQRFQNNVYCGTYDDGLWHSTDGGDTWQKVSPGITHPNVMSVAVSSTELRKNRSVVYAGTEPSGLFRSEDSGETWEEKKSMLELPSSSTWSFPPRPDTNHVRWIQTDPFQRSKLYVCIEAGALIQTQDGGINWEDRVSGGPYDTHVLATHSKARGRLYSSAGDCYFESHDGGATWEKPRAGLRHYYLYGIAVDSGAPETIVVSASPGPFEAHNPNEAESYLYRRTEGQNWKLINGGSFEPQGTIISMLCAGNDGEFYALNNRGIFYSDDSGVSWKKLEIEWPKSYLSEHPWGIALSED